jgi:hypothetical protein
VQKTEAVGQQFDYHMTDRHSNRTDAKDESLFAAMVCTFQITMILKKDVHKCSNGYSSFLFKEKNTTGIFTTETYFT